MCSLPMARYYTIKDADQKTLYSKANQLLVGDPEVDNCCAEKICILPNRGLDRTKVPIFLGIQGGSRCLACVETGDGPSLQLENLQKVVPRVRTHTVKALIGQAPEASRADISISSLIDLQNLQKDVNIEDLYKCGEQATRFTFFQRSLGSAFRLEASAWPGWFLCGPTEPQQPV